MISLELLLTLLLFVKMQAEDEKSSGGRAGSVDDFEETKKKLKEKFTDMNALETFWSTWASILIKKHPDRAARYQAIEEAIVPPDCWNHTKSSVRLTAEVVQYKS
jgi:hypothetical protein